MCAKDAKEVIEIMEKENIFFLEVWFTDILGFLKSFTITRTEVPVAFEEGAGFDGSSIEGFARIDESDMIARPDPTTFQILPWQDSGKVARVFADIFEPNGKPFDGDPRNVLKKNLERAKKKNLTFNVGPEMEFFYFKSPDSPELLDKGGYFDLVPRDEAVSLRRETAIALELMGIPVERAQHEAAPSQHEIDLRYSDALTMADSVVTLRFIVKEVAFRNGVFASFMPKPLADENGSGMHTHMSLFDEKSNTFFDTKDKYHLSETAKSFMAGLLRHAREITSVTNQWVNSYKRLVPGYEAPVYLSWALRNRSDLIRIPMYKPGKENATRIEFRSPDPACNPYLAFSVLLASGLEGVDNNYELPQPIEENIYEMSESERKEKGIRALPGSLIEAVALTEESEFVRSALGNHVFEHFIKNKKIEWDMFRKHVTAYEVNKYLPIL
ncbi:MAG: glutamine synthetase family protein [Planctomycetota bacterium]